jgi:hypothetical protein
LPLFRASGAFVDFTVTNLFDEDGQVGGDRAVSTRVNPQCRQTANPALRCALFNPYTETPVEGVHYVLSPTFGEPVSVSHYQMPRTYSFSAGVRF